MLHNRSVPQLILVRATNSHSFGRTIQNTGWWPGLGQHPFQPLAMLFVGLVWNRTVEGRLVTEQPAEFPDRQSCQCPLSGHTNDVATYCLEVTMMALIANCPRAHLGRRDTICAPPPRPIDMILNDFNRCCHLEDLTQGGLVITRFSVKLGCIAKLDGTHNFEVLIS